MREYVLECNEYTWHFLYNKDKNKIPSMEHLKKWQDTIDEFKDFGPWKDEDVANILENHEQLYKTLGFIFKIEDIIPIQYFMKNTFLPNIVDCQAMVNIVDNVAYARVRQGEEETIYGVLDSEEINGSSKKYNEIDEWYKPTKKIEEKFNTLDLNDRKIFSSETEVIHDLLNNSKYLSKSTEENLSNSIENTKNSMIKDNFWMNDYGNFWVLTSHKENKDFIQLGKFARDYGNNHYSHDVMPEDTVLVGRKCDKFIGYTFRPFVIQAPNGIERSIIAKKLLREGSQNYAKITIEPDYSFII